MPEPGTPEAFLDAMFDYAEEEFGLSPFSSKHALTAIIEGVDQLKRDLSAARDALRDIRQHEGIGLDMTMGCTHCYQIATDALSFTQPEQTQERHFGVHDRGVCPPECPMRRGAVGRDREFRMGNTTLCPKCMHMNVGHIDGRCRHCVCGRTR